MQQSYLNRLDQKALAQLQTSVLKAQFKDEQIDHEGSFLNYFHNNLHRYRMALYEIFVMELTPTTAISPTRFLVGFTVTAKSCPSAVRNSISRPTEKLPAAASASARRRAAA